MVESVPPASLSDFAEEMTKRHHDLKSKAEGRKVEFSVPPENIRAAVASIDELIPDAFPESVFGVDLQNDKYELVYFFWSRTMQMLCELRVQLEGPAPSVETVSDIFPGLEWHERETCEMFGINFTGHPDLRLLLLPDELEGKYPLRKSFQTDRSRLNESGLTARPAAGQKDGGVSE